MIKNPKLIVWLAQGFGIGRIPFAPGTFGSILGLAWLAVLLLPGSWWVLGLGIIASTAASIWLCDEAERILNQRDPSSVVVDEIIAIPLCVVSWLAFTHAPLQPANLFVDHWPVALAAFALFRFFDILKPWPVGKSQSLPGGWGVTIDDVLAAVYVNLVMLVYLWFKG